MGVGENLIVNGVRFASRLFLEIAGDNTEVSISPAKTLIRISNPPYNETAKTFSLFGGEASPGSIGSFAAFSGAKAQGDGSFALGYQCQAGNTYAFGLGAFNNASGVASCAIGENNTTHGTNAIGLGFTVNATATYSGGIGWFSSSTAVGALALGLNTGAIRWGELGHSGGRADLLFQGLHALDMGAEIDATSGKLQTGDTADPDLHLPSQTLISMRVRVLGVTPGGAKRGHQISELLIWSESGRPVVLDQQVDIAVNLAAGWTVTFEADAINNVLAIRCDSGVDNVRWTARVEFAESYQV